MFDIAGWSEMGQRPYQEDRYIAEWSRDKTIGVIAVFDGHGGANTSDLLSKITGNVIINALSRSMQQNTTMSVDKIYDILCDAVKKLHDITKDDVSGSTAAIVVYVQQLFFIINIGDSRAVLVKKTGEVERLSYDHKPGYPYELALLEKRGKKVGYTKHRIARIVGSNGSSLAVSRAFGDKDIEPMHDPDIVYLNANDPNNFTILLGTDGIYDAVHEVVIEKILKQELQQQQANKKEFLLRLTEKVMLEAIRRGSKDNKTLLAIAL